MPGKSPRDWFAPREVSGTGFTFSSLQKAALGILVVGVFVLGVQVFRLATQPVETLRSIVDSDDASSNAFFTQRETLVLAIYFERWLSGNEVRRTVLVRRALLGQRLNVKDQAGVANAERANPAYLESLRKIDACLTDAGDEKLSSFDQILQRQACGEALDVLVFAARQLAIDISGSGDERLREIVRRDRLERRNQTSRLLLTIGSLTLVGGFLSISRTRSLWLVRRVVEQDQLKLEQAQNLLQTVEAELTSNIAKDKLRRSEDERLDAAVRILTTDIRRATSATIVIDRLASGLDRFLHSDLVYVHLFGNAEDPDRASLVRKNMASPVGMGEVGINRGLSYEILQAVETVWRAVGSKPTIMGELKRSFSSELLVKLSQLGVHDNSLLIPMGEGQTIFGFVIVERSGASTWQPNEIDSTQNVVSQAANSIGGFRASFLVQEIRKNQQVVSELRQLDRMKDEFTANVNHELRTPLTSIIGYLDVIANESDDLNPTTNKYLSIVRRNADRLLELIERLLVVSRSGSGSGILKSEEVDLAEVVSRSVEAVRAKDPSESVVIKTSIDPPSIRMNGDRLRLEQIVVNLVSNAVKFSPDYSTVHVELRRSDDTEDGHPEAILKVRDVGIGIPADEIPQLFDRFFRASNAEKALIPGTGLGLSIVELFVVDHHGSISVESTVGVGTTMTVRLPLSQIS